MPIRRDVLRSKAFVIAALAAVFAAATLNIQELQFEPLGLWARIVCPLLLFNGLVGSLFGSRLLRILGWFGITLYLVCATGMILPGEDYMAGGPDGPALMAPRLPNVQETALRFVLFITLIVVLTVSYIKTGKFQGHNT